MNLIDYYITPEEYDIAEKNGLHFSTVNSRVRDLMWCKERAITEKPANMSKGLEKYKLEAIKNGIDEHNFYQRVRRGWTPEKASTTPKIDTQNKEWLDSHRKNNIHANRKYPGWVYESIEKNNIKKVTFLSRIRRGWSLEKACTTPVQGKGKHDRSDHYWKKLSISK